MADPVPEDGDDAGLGPAEENLAHDATRIAKAKPPRNAFTELMSSKRKPDPAGDDDPSAKRPNAGAPTSRSIMRHLNPSWRDGLLSYIMHPERFPNVVLRTTEHTVLIRDMYPKATVHLLLLPRSPAHYLVHPQDAFSDPSFLSLIRTEAATARKIAAAELARRLGSFSASSKSRYEAMESGVPEEEWPAGRDWEAEIMVGVHAHPSMNHLHVHVLSRDMRSECVKHAKHYNTFVTDFFLPLADMPLDKEDRRRGVKYQNGNLKADLVCWRCGRDFGRGFKELKGHLEEEFESWKKV